MLTTTPEIVLMFVLFFAPPGGGKPQREELYVTTDKAACEAQAAEWTAKMAPLKFLCIAHNQKKLKAPAYKPDAGDDE
jgi:hypothetical protein